VRFRRVFDNERRVNAKIVHQPSDISAATLTGVKMQFARYIDITTRTRYRHERTIIFTPQFSFCFPQPPHPAHCGLFVTRSFSYKHSFF